MIIDMKTILFRVKIFLLSVGPFVQNKITLYLENNQPQELENIASKKNILITTEFINNYLSTIKFHPQYPSIRRIKDISMLHEDVLFLLRFFAIACKGSVVEFGTYVGGSTIALASGRKMFDLTPIISIEPGGKAAHPQIPSADIYADLLVNISRFDVADYVCVKKGVSYQPAIHEYIKARVSDENIGLLFIDSDGHVDRDMEHYAYLLNDECILVFDDYVSEYAPEKCELIRKWVTQAEAEGTVTTLGVYGWGTWIGLFHRYQIDV